MWWKNCLWRQLIWKFNQLNSCEWKKRCLEGGKSRNKGEWKRKTQQVAVVSQRVTVSQLSSPTNSFKTIDWWTIRWLSNAGYHGKGTTEQKSPTHGAFFDTFPVPQKPHWDFNSLRVWYMVYGILVSKAPKSR